MSPSLDLSREIGHLIDFFEENDTLREFPRHAGLSDKLQQQPARAWGIGMLIYTLADGARLKVALKAARALKHYEKEGNIFGVTPQKSDFIPRVQSYVAFVLAKLALVTTARAQVSVTPDSP